MKKNYLKPQSEIVPVKTDKPLLAGSASAEQMNEVSGSWEDDDQI